MDLAFAYSLLEAALEQLQCVFESNHGLTWWFDYRTEHTAQIEPYGVRAKATPVLALHYGQ